MRAFYAIFLDAAAQENVSQLVQSIQSNMPDELLSRMRWVNPPQRHLTLQFFPNFPNEQVDFYVHKVTQMLDHIYAFEIMISHFAPFPEKESGDIFAALINDSDNLFALHAVLQHCAVLANLQTSHQDANRNFKPHITLARGGVPSSSIPINLKIPVTEICFAESKLINGKHEYSIMKRHQLKK